jgi:Flp pilus assembly protein TadG
MDHREPASPAEKRRKLLKWPRPWAESEVGQALVEFTMILPLFLLLLFALVDFGRGFYTWLLVTNAAREGARVAATQQDTNAVQTRIYDAVCSSYPSNCSLNVSKLTWTNKASANIQGPRGEAVEIDLSFDFDYATPIGNILAIVSGGSLSEPTITAHSSMRLE